MSNSPVQVVLNPDNFITAREPGMGGLHKEFYEGHPQEFIKHKNDIVTSLRNIESSLEKNEYSSVGFAKLILKRSGWAKSHRPTKSIFQNKIAPIVGAGGVGELFVELNKSSIEKIISKVQSAETDLKYKNVKKPNGKSKIEPNPSRERSEIGAIEKIIPYSSSDKRSFSVETALKWLSDPRTGGSYIIELFEVPPPKPDWDILPPEKVNLFQSFLNGLSNVGRGLFAQTFSDTSENFPIMGVRLGILNEDADSKIISSSHKKPNITQFDNNPKKHIQLLGFLDAHPLVKKIHLPPIITRSQNTPSISTEVVNLPIPIENKKYPKVAIVDGGVGSCLNSWIISRWGYISDSDKDEVHGTFIGGLLVAGANINGFDICPENDGCHIIDVDILPSENAASSSYFNSTSEFLDELEIAVEKLKSSTGVRIFNFSLNVEQAVESDVYHPFSRRLDQIAFKHDVIFIISAGNTKFSRPEWPEEPSRALAMLAAHQDDKIKVPSESVRNLCVAAVNPKGVEPAIFQAPSCYSRRGPGLRIGLKPDIAHFGGAGTKHVINGTGLFSLTPGGNRADGCGTSYSAPIAAKTIATLENMIEGEVSRETLMALTIHNAIIPKRLEDPLIKPIARHMVGFGIPKSASDIISGSDHAITLVFANRLAEGKKMQFSFSWPKSLVVNGKCRGEAKITIVSSPPLDYKYGVEFVRANIHASLLQENSKGKFVGRLEPIYLPEGSGLGNDEADLIEHSLKWGPVKVYTKKFPKGVGPSTNWRLDVGYLLRDGETLPDNGIPFTALLTISDPDAEKPVFNDVRQTLQAIGIETADITTAARVVTRI